MINFSPYNPPMLFQKKPTAKIIQQTPVWSTTVDSYSSIALKDIPNLSPDITLELIVKTNDGTGNEVEVQAYSNVAIDDPKYKTKLADWERANEKYQNELAKWNKQKEEYDKKKAAKDEEAEKKLFERLKKKYG